VRGRRIGGRAVRSMIQVHDTRRREPPTVAFIASPYVGHFYPTVALARALTARGFAIVYLLVEASDEIKAVIHAEGFECEDISPLFELARLGSLVERGRVRQARALCRHQIDRFKALADARGIALVFVDNFLRFFGALATFNEIPVITACFNYVENVKLARPVQPRDLSMGDRPEAPGLTRAAKQWVRTPGLLVDRCCGVQRRVVRFARTRGLETEYFIYNQTTLFKYPVVYFAPRELLRDDELEGTFLGLCVDEHRRVECRRPWSTSRDNRPVVFVSLGTVRDCLPERRLEFFRSVARAFASQPRLRAIVHIGQDVEPPAIGEVPENVEVHQTVPQLDAIARSDLVITHGGLGGIKECIYFGKPMLVFPLMTEELDNARRIVSHGLGILGGLTTVPPDRIVRHVHSLLVDRRFADRVSAMKHSIERSDGLGRGLDLATRLIAAGDRSLSAVAC
jgi:MGT family glycosyltransferase